MSPTSSILMVVTSHPAIDNEHPTGVWFEEFATPYALFRAQGYAVTVASPKGGEAPIDPRSLEGCRMTPENASARSALQATRPLDDSLKAENFDAIFFPGGHGAMFDLPDNPEVQRLVTEGLRGDKIVAAVCHGPACLAGARLPDGTPLVRGRRLTAFSDDEEREVGMDRLMPFPLEARLRELGAEFASAANWQDHVVVDGRLITGQNPQSSASTSMAVIRLLSN